MQREDIDKWRIAPRLIVIGYAWLMYEVSMWFMGLVEPNGSQAAFVSTMVGASAVIFGLYVNSGSGK